jgi:riboflavin kinase/FMN adenylyltransferase
VYNPNLHVLPDPGSHATRRLAADLTRRHSYGFIPVPPATIITIGVFDGVHRGHRALLSRSVEWQRARSPAARILALAFDPHPLASLRPQAAPVRLSTFEQRACWLREAGADVVERLDPSPDLLALEPQAFVETHLAPRRPVCIVEGADFRFGRGRAAGVDTLRELGRRAGFEVDVVAPVEIALGDQTVATASSSLVRRLVGAGRVRDAACALGRPYELEGTVIQGDRRGRLLGFPTINLDTPCLIPATGVYAAEAVLPDGRVAPAAVSAGPRPMYPGSPPTIEAHLIGLSPESAERPNLPGLPEYGWPVRLRLAAWLRDQVQFGSVEALVAQIDRDCARAVELLGASAEPAHA